MRFEVRVNREFNVGARSTRKVECNAAELNLPAEARNSNPERARRCIEPLE